jgi:dTDP-D-glucose 4,6-dehydratase
MGKGLNIRDWIHVDDHVDALIAISQKGKIGESYNIGSNNEINNNKIVNTICSVGHSLIDQNFDYKSLIRHVDDRPGHDFRYAMDTRKINNSIGWMSKINFDEGITATFDWYLNNMSWVESCLEKDNVLKRQGVL